MFATAFRSHLIPIGSGVCQGWVPPHCQHTSVANHGRQQIQGQSKSRAAQRDAATTPAVTVNNAKRWTTQWFVQHGQHAFHIFSYLFIFHIFLYYIFSCQYECTNMTMTLWQTHSTSVSTCFNIALNVFRADTAGEREANPWHDNYSRQFDIF